MPLGTASQRFFSPPRRVLPITPPRWPHAFYIALVGH